MQEFIYLKGKKDRLVVQLDSSVEYETLREQLILKLKQAELLIGKNPIAIEFSNRILSEKEEQELLMDIKSKTTINVAFLITDEQHFKDFFSNMLQTADKQEVKSNKKTGEKLTKLHKGTLRSGAMLECDGNLIILGDVNPGAIIKASGSIIVLGYLNGSAYAGENREDNCFIGALSLNPIQIKLGEIIAKNPSKDILDANKIRKDLAFEVAYLDDGKIYVEEFSKKLLEKLIK